MVSLFNKYRPQKFGDIIGQRHAVEIITKSILRSTIGHAYIFSGSRGCGKTSAARILAKALNCKSPNGYEPCGTCSNCVAITAGDSLDVIEVDGASNNGVENIRGLKENVTLSPFDSRYKIYIIDEVHMLSTGAFNALLKTLEEPPEYVIFIMATTEPQKIPVTIRSRCQHIPFHSITTEDIFSRLKYVCEQEHVKSEDNALWEISRQADGALRDALSLLEQVIASGEITLPNVERLVGAGSRPAFERWLRTFRTDPSGGYVILKQMTDSGASILRVFEEMFSLIRNLWLVSKWRNIANSLGVSEQEKAFLTEEVSHWRPEELNKLLRLIVRMLAGARRGVKPDILLGMFMLYLEPAPRPAVPASAPRPAVPASAPRPAAQAPAPRPAVPVQAPRPAPAPKPKVINDPALRNKIIETVHAQDFTIYCALFDAEARTENGDLILTMRHRYCFSWFKATRRAAKLRSILSDYNRVILCHKDDSFVCPDMRLAIPIGPSIPDPPKPEPEPPKPKRPEATEGLNERSKIGKFINELARMSAKAELLMIRRNETETEDEAYEGENDDE